MKVLVTGSAGFIGFSLAKKFLENSYQVIGVDNINDYYDPNLKKIRLKLLKGYTKFTFVKADISDFKKLRTIFQNNKFKAVFHLAAQAGVRYSILNPDAYFKSNIIGFYNILKLMNEFNSGKLFYASTSSVYGDQKKFPLKESFNTNNPLSFYASSKKINEVMASSYYNTYGLSCIGLRFFTVYGPFGRPDMSLFKFIDAGLNNKKIELFNFGKHTRDFTYIDDIVNSIFNLHIKTFKQKKPIYEIFNIGNSKPIKLKYFVKCIEKIIGKKLKIKYLPMQKGDVEKTHSSSKKLFDYINYKPNINVEKGIKNFFEWYLKYYK